MRVRKPVSAFNQFDLGHRAGYLAALAAFLLVAVGLAYVSWGSAVSQARPAANDGSTVISCFHPESKRFSFRDQPSRCFIVGNGGKRIRGVSIEGMKWGHWGAKTTRAAYGNEVRGGKAIRVIAYRLITCMDGRDWYSRAVIFYPGNGRWFGLALPVCGRALSLGDRPRFDRR